METIYPGDALVPALDPGLMNLRLSVKQGYAGRSQNGRSTIVAPRICDGLRAVMNSVWEWRLTPVHFKPGQK